MINEVKEKKIKNPDESVNFFKLLAWSGSSVSVAINVLLIGFLTFYSTETLGMSATLVGTLLLFSKLFDGFTDILAGYIVDRTNTKIGRGRPYELALIGLWVTTILMFSCPPAYSMMAKSIWLIVMYTFNQSVFRTFLSANQTVYMVRAFKSQKQYVGYTAYSSVVVFVGAIIFNIAFPVLMSSIATSPAGWTQLVTYVAVICFTLGIFRFIFIKEVNDIDIKSENKVNFSDVVEVLKTNKYVYLLCLMALVYSTAVSIGGGISVYYFQYIIGNVGLMSVVAIATIVAIPIPILFPILIKKFSIVKLIIIGLVLSVIGYLVLFFANASLALIVVGSLIYGIGNVPINMIAPLLIIDCSEFNEWEGRQRMEGTIGALYGFAGKIGTAIGAGSVGIILGLGGFVGGVETQSDSAILTIRLLYSIIPMLLMIVAIFVATRFDLEKRMPKIREENEIAREKVRMDANMFRQGKKD